MWKKTMESELGILVIRGIDLLRGSKEAANQDSEGCRGSSSTAAWRCSEDRSTMGTGETDAAR
jgi:hypothetical protein